MGFNLTKNGLDLAGWSICFASFWTKNFNISKWQKMADRGAKEPISRGF